MWKECDCGELSHIFIHNIFSCFPGHVLHAEHFSNVSISQANYIWYHSHDQISEVIGQLFEWRETKLANACLSEDSLTGTLSWEFPCFWEKDAINLLRSSSLHNKMATSPWSKVWEIYMWQKKIYNLKSAHWALAAPGADFEGSFN